MVDVAGDIYTASTVENRYHHHGAGLQKFDDWPAVANDVSPVVAAISAKYVAAAAADFVVYAAASMPVAAEHDLV